MLRSAYLSSPEVGIRQFSGVINYANGEKH